MIAFFCSLNMGITASIWIMFVYVCITAVFINIWMFIYEPIVYALRHFFKVSLSNGPMVTWLILLCDLNISLG